MSVSILYAAELRLGDGGLREGQRGQREGRAGGHSGHSAQGGRPPGEGREGGRDMGQKRSYGTEKQHRQDRVTRRSIATRRPAQPLYCMQHPHSDGAANSLELPPSVPTSAIVVIGFRGAQRRTSSPWPASIRPTTCIKRYSSATGCVQDTQRPPRLLTVQSPAPRLVESDGNASGHVCNVRAPPPTWRGRPREQVSQAPATVNRQSASIIPIFSRLQSLVDCVP